MSQQYVLLRKENDLLNSLIGQSFNQKSKFEAEKILDEIHSKADSRMIGKKSLCYIVDNSEIKGVGGSTLMKNKKSGEIVSNLILEQFGILLAGTFAFLRTAGNKVVTIKDQSGINRTVSTITAGRSYLQLVSGIAVGSFLQVGSGITAPARTDFKIQTAFGTAPESATFIPISDPVWNSSLGNFRVSGLIVAGGSGTINESLLGESWRDATTSQRLFTAFRDIISPGQAFVVGQIIALEYTIQL